MSKHEFTRIVVTRPDGRREVVGRWGVHDVHSLGREFAATGSGKVEAVRHVSRGASMGEWVGGTHVAAPKREQTLGISRP